MYEVNSEGQWKETIVVSVFVLHVIVFDHWTCYVQFFFVKLEESHLTFHPGLLIVSFFTAQKA